ncbi:MAG: EAL domain-containing protein, partial [Eubacteriales bacterium]|nr:EAL domain-containing protein [Eubacteriales bacterium]
INLRETAATVNALQRERLTGLYSREAFFEKVEELVGDHEPGYYVMACFDIDSFKVFNDQYGTEKGDEALRYIASVFQRGFVPLGGICCRIMADNFAVLYPASLLETDALIQIRTKACNIEGLASPLTFSIGRYLVNDLSLSPSAMYDRAVLAEAAAKGKYGHNIAQYDESMRDFLLGEQKIVTEMDGALQNRQFEVWFQPQYNHATGALIGAEALVRWRHPKRGLIPPNMFIPIFEKNGFIYELDKYVWEETCRYLRKWTDEGRAPLPVSVNVSRNDIFRKDLIDVLTGLIKKYRIPVEQLRLEVTESAFAKSAQQIVDVVKRLIELGFTVEIDDFGSGYSSLNTLKSVPAQVVKLDMRFLEDNEDSQRGGNILESIVRMTKWLGMSVIAEGVELIEQADFLKSIGCSYVQGYLYARPMPASEYEAHCEGAGKEERLLTMQTVENLDNERFWDPKSMDTLIFNSYVGGACIFEYHNGKQEMLRVNNKYVKVFGEQVTDDDIYSHNVFDYMDQADRDIFFGSILRAIETGKECTCETKVMGLYNVHKPLHIRSTMQVIARAGDRYLFYSTVINTTAQREAEQSERKLMRQLKTVMENVNCGITAVRIDGDTVEYLLSNDLYFELIGYTRQQFEAEIGGNGYAAIHPEDRLRVVQVTEQVNSTGNPARIEYRAVKRDGSVIWMRSNISTTYFEGTQQPVQITTYTDFTAEKLAAQELLDNLPGGAALFSYEKGELSIVHLNKRYWELVNRSPEVVLENKPLKSVHPEDANIVIRELDSAILQKRDVVCDIRMRYGENEYRPFHVIARMVEKEEGKYAVYATYIPISDEAMSIQEMLPVALNAMMGASSDISFVKDKNLRYICCSRMVCQLLGVDNEKDVIGKSDYELINPAYVDQYAAEDRQVLETGESIVDSEKALPAVNGIQRYATISLYPLKDSGGNVVGVYGVGRDITKAREMQSQLELLTNNLPGGIAIFEGRPEALEDIRVTYFSDGFCRLYGYTREEYRQASMDNPLDLVLEQDVPKVKEAIKAFVSEHTPIDCVYRAKVKDGSYKWINLKATAGEPRGDNLTVNAVMFDVTVRQQALEQLRVSEEENRLAIEHSKNVVCKFNILERTLAVSPVANPMFETGHTLVDVPYGEVRRGSVSPETANVYTEFYESIIRGEKKGSMIYQRLSTNGWRWLEAHFSTIFSEDGKPVSAVVSFRDVTDRLEKDAAYKKWQQSLQEKDPNTYTLYRCNVNRKTLFDTVEGTLLYVEFAPGPFDFDEHTAQYAEQCVVGEDQEKFITFLNVDVLLSMYYQGKRNLQLEYREKLPESGYRWLRLTLDLVESPYSSDVEAYMLFEDIDAMKRAELINIERAERDALTGVYNRNAFSEKVDEIIRTSKPYVQHALLMLDIDGFKLVNDAFGHSTGDQVLASIASSVCGALEPEDLVGRLGGDEFAVFLKDIKSDAIAATKAQQLCALLRRSYSMEVEISGSVGIAVSPRDGSDFEALYKKADSALYYVKGYGKDNYAFYHEDMADEHLRLEINLDDAGHVMSKERKRRMLIVDDSQIDHALLCNMFANDFIIEKAKDGNTALIRLRHYGAAISVVLLDLMMPGMDGFAVLEKMHQSAELSAIPVIVVSGDDNRETSLKAIRAGATDFVTKPVDSDVLHIRVQSAISKAENERLRAQNSFLEYQNNEVSRYRTVLSRSGTVIVEHDWISGTFQYDPSISKYLAGTYDNRKFWHVLLTDLVADTATVKTMQELVHDIASDRQRLDDCIYVQLKTPSYIRHWFRMNIYKVVNEFGLTGKLYITFNDVGKKRPGEEPAN